MQSMQRCASCGFWFTESVAPSTHCPRCNEDLPAAVPGSSRRVPVARTASWAEAGFFEDLLRRHQIEAQLLEEDQFDAASGVWQPRLLLVVDEAEAGRAAELMHQEIEGTASGTGSLDVDDPADPSAIPGTGLGWAEPTVLPDAAARPQAPSGPLWTPMLFALAVGGLAYWAVRNVVPPRQAAAPRREAPRPTKGALDLKRYLMRHPGPWRSVAPDGSVRVLVHDARTETIHVNEDADGDGHFERHEVFPTR